MTVGVAEGENNLSGAQAEDASVETPVQLIASLRKIVNNPEFSDVTFLCSDGKQVKASRIHLAARSGVLKNLLMNGMAESSANEISLANVSSPVMLSILEILYTGSLLDYAPGDWKMGWEVIVASRFFLLPELEVVARKFMERFVSRTADDLPKLAIMLNEALGFKSFFKTSDYLLCKLVDTLTLSWSVSTYAESLSEDAFHYILVNTNDSLENMDILSFREYLRFRSIIEWWLYQSDVSYDSRENIMNRLLPDKANFLEVCGRPEDCLEIAEETAEVLKCDWDPLPTGNMPKRLLSQVDYRWIHPTVLSKVLEPLGILPEEILTAYRYHAVCRPMCLENIEYGWHHDPCYRTFERGHVIYFTGETPGLAVLGQFIDYGSNLVYEWEFLLEDDSYLFAELGLVTSLGPPYDKRLSHHDSARVLRFSEYEGIERSIQHAGGTWLKVGEAHPFNAGARVTFVFDASSDGGTCAISIGSRNLGKVWKFKAHHGRVYYPAVSFGSGCQGRVRIKLKRGF
jgi:hypothetical protein